MLLETEGHLIMIKGSVHQENIIIINMYTDNRFTKIHERKMDRMEEQIENSTIIPHSQ